MKTINVSSVYCILNTVSNKRYIGSTKNFADRKGNHLFRLRHNQHYSLGLQQDFNQLGEEFFKFIILEEVRTFEWAELLKREQYWIKKLKPEYNKSQSEVSRNAAKRLRDYWSTHVRVLTETERQTISDAHKGPKNYWWGKKHTLETRKRMSDGRSKKIWSGFISPNGTVYKDIKNLSAFCREHNLEKNAMRRVEIGTQRKHKGWYKV